MKRLLAYLFIVLGLGLNFNAYAAPDGKGQIQLSEDVVKSFIDYIVGDIGTQKSVFNKPSTFWITIDGSRSYWWYKPQGGGSNKDRAQTYSDLFQANEAITQGDGVGPATSKPTEERAKCERHHGQSCSRFAKGRYVSWNNGINPKGKAAKFSSKMSESEVRAKLTKLGFYDNDFLDTTTTPKITKKKETKKVEKKITKKTSQTQKVAKKYCLFIKPDGTTNYRSHDQMTFEATYECPIPQAGYGKWVEISFEDYKKYNPKFYPDENNIVKKEKIITPKKKVKVAKVEEPKQEEFKPKKTNQDNEAPVIEIAEAITVDSQAYTLKGKVKDKSQVYLTIDGRQVDVKKGKFKLDRFNINPDVIEEIKIVAIDQWNNKSEKQLK